ncbi:MAG: YaiI/YqxD family protein [Burkholderiales bacterium]|nr:YaiI/YqxD family protein [Burkholderiales bacterium]
MRIWVDADACPAAVKEILFRAAERCEVEVVLVANQPLRVPPSRFVRSIQVERGFDVADNRIAKEIAPEDLAITADVPLAALVVERGAQALHPRGELYTAANVREHLTMRDFMTGLRDSGVQTAGPARMSQSDRQAFANQLDRLLARRAPQ